MNIIHILRGKAIPESKNSINRVVYTLAANQVEAGNDVTIWGLHNDAIHNYPPRNFKTILFKTGFLGLWLSKSLLKQLNQLKTTDMVHLHGTFNLECLLLAYRLIKKNIPFIYTPYCSSARRHRIIKLPITKWIIDQLELYVMKHAKMVQFVQSFELEWYKDAEINASYIPVGQHVHHLQFKFSPVLIEEYPVFATLYLKEHDTGGLLTIIHAFELYKRAGGMGELWIITDVNDYKSIKNDISRSGIEKFSRFMFYTTEQEKLNLIANTTWMVAMNAKDILPLHVLETLAIQVPVIVNEQSDLADKIVAYQAGYNIGEPTPVALCKTFIHAYYEVNRARELGKNGYRLVLREYNWNKIIEQFNH